jgi:hypothetical protein
VPAGPTPSAKHKPRGSREERGDFFAPHDIWLDSRGSLYVSEVFRSATKGKKPEGRDYHTLQKLVKISSK